MRWLRAVVIVLILCMAACSEGPKGPGVLVTFDTVCDKANDGKRLALEGYLDFPESFKSKEITIMMRMHPALGPRGPAVVGVSVPLGNAANQVELPPKQFTAADLKLHTQDGQVAGFRDKVKVSGTMYFPSSIAQVEFRCGLTNVLIERAGQ